MELEVQQRGHPKKPPAFQPGAACKSIFADQFYSMIL
jgi:hypothetical protein